MLADLKKGSLLVTGGAGFMGSAFIRYVLDGTSFRGHLVNLDALTYAGNLANLQDVAEDPRYHFVHGDIRNDKLLEELYAKYQFQAIVNFAAESHVDRSIQSSDPFVETNVKGTNILLEFVRRHPSVHFHQISTDEVYGSTPAGQKFVEGALYRPSSPYAASKAAADHLVQSYAHTYGISTTISHSTNNYGPYQFPEKLIPLMILNCLRGKKLPVYGKGDQIRDWLYVDDHARAIWMILEKGKKGAAYHIAGQCERKNIDVIYAIIDEVANVEGEDSQKYINLITSVADRPGHDQRYALDTTKIEREIGFRPKYEFNEGIYQTVQWYLSEKEWLKQIESGAYRLWVDTQYKSNLLEDLQQVKHVSQ